jgi:molecular chaperone GrpE
MTATGDDDEAQDSGDVETASPCAALAEDLAALRRDVSEIHAAVEQNGTFLRGRDAAFDRLYQELDSCKRHRALEDLRPLYIDLILFYDRIQAAQQTSASAGAIAISSLQEELLEILLRRDIEPIACDGDAFTPALQRAAGNETVASRERDGKVIRVLREGFLCRGLVLRPQEVIIGKYR